MPEKYFAKRMDEYRDSKGEEVARSNELLAPTYTAECNCGQHETCFLMGSNPNGETECGRRGINHHMVRHSCMLTSCSNTGCNGRC